MKKNLIIRGVLYREVIKGYEKIKQLVLPQIYRETALRGLHNDVGHQGRGRTLSLLQERFLAVSVCGGRTMNFKMWTLPKKERVNSWALLVNIKSRYPLELVCMDFLTLEPSKGGIANILAITDHFTKFAVAIPTKNQTVKTTADALCDNFVL